MKTIIPFITILAILSCTSMKDDLHKICITAEKIQNNDAINRTEKLSSFVKEINQLNLSNDIKKFFIELSMKEDSPTYQDFLDFAQEHGINEWKCEELKQMIESQ